MSKQHVKSGKKDRLRRGLAGILSLALLIALLPAAIVPASAADHWATPYVNTLAEWGVMRGDINGNMAPERSITRAEFVTMMNRAYGYTRTAGHPFTDVTIRDWFHDDIDIAYNMGYFKGTSGTTASPNDPLTREQAAVLLARNMMLQPTVGETLGFSDTRELADWSRDLVGAATEQGILNGYSDGTFKPQNNITRGEVAAMLVRAIGTPIQEEGNHTLGNVYGNVTVNTPGVELRDGIITGNLYLTGGIDLGDVLLENVNVLGEIIVSGAGESNSAQSSIVLRNVTANRMTVDSISDQFVTIRAEGNTDIKETTVRTSAYVDDSTLPGYGLWKIIQDGGSLLQLAGNAKEVVNKTPNSQLQIAQGVADKVTVDEKATGSSVMIDGDARVDELDLDVATSVTGEGDIKDLNVGAAGSTVEQMPDTVTIRPGITADVNGSTMDSSQAAQASAEPLILAGYPKAKNVAPTSATLVFSGNKAGTIYWAVSAVADGSVSEEDLIENPSYGGKIIKSGSIKADKAAEEFTANVTGLTQDGSYYISAILVDSRGKHSPVKVTAFTTPDGTTPAFTSAPVVTMANTKVAQVTGTPNKSCQLFWALLPQDATAPTPAEFKANAVRGNVGYGSMDVTKNVSQSVNVNRGNLKEKTTYIAYLWLTDHNGAKSSQVYRVPVYIPDETPPQVNDVRQTNGDATSVEVSFNMNETGKLYWAIVTDEMHDKKSFIPYDGFGLDGTDNPTFDAGVPLFFSDDHKDIELSSKIKVMAGAGSSGAIVAGSTNVTSAGSVTRVLMSATRGLDPNVYNTSTFYFYYVGEDSEKPGNLSERIGVLEVNVKDTEPPKFIEQRFDHYNENDSVHPLADTSIQLVFSEPLQHGANGDRTLRYLNLYQEVENLVNQGATEDPDGQLYQARLALARELHEGIKLYTGTGVEVNSEFYPQTTDNSLHLDGDNTLNYRYAQVTRENGQFVISFPHNVRVVNPDGSQGTVHAADLDSGMTYYFEFNNIYDCASTPNRLQSNQSNGTYRAPEFRVAYAQVELGVVAKLPAVMKNATGLWSGMLDENTDPSNGSNSEWKTNPPQRIDRMFTLDPVFDPAVYESNPDMRYDVLIWSDTDMEISLYRRDKGSDDDVPWDLVGTTEFYGTANEAPNGLYRSVTRDIQKQNFYDSLSEMRGDGWEYAIHVNKLTYRGGYDALYKSWNETVNLQVMVVAGSTIALASLKEGFQNAASFDKAIARDDLDSIGSPDPMPAQMVFTDRQAPLITDVHIKEASDTSPVITVTLDHPGQVNYVFIPLGALMYRPAGSTESQRIPSTVTITEPLISDDTTDYHITGYTSPYTIRINETDTTQPEIKDIERIDHPSAGHVGTGNLGTVVYSPSWNAVVGSTFASPMYQGRTAFTSADQAATIPLPPNGLTPNTIYYLALVPQGSTPDSIAQETRLFRFITDAAKVPILHLSEAGSINVNATTDCTAQVHSILLRQNNLTDTIFSKKLSEKDSSGNDLMISPAPAGSSGYADWTVLRALQEDYGDGSRRSVFDVLASEALKRQIMQYVESGATNGLPPDTRYDVWGPQQVPQRPTDNSGGDRVIEFDSSNADADELYLCVGVAYTSKDGPRGFRALPNLQLVDTNPPKVTSVSNGLFYDEANKLYKGTVSITFDKELFVREDGVLRAVAQSSEAGSGIPATLTGANYTVNGVTKNEYRPLTALMTLPGGNGISVPNQTGGYTTTRTIVFEMSSASPVFSVTLPAFASRWGRTQVSFSVNVRYDGGKWTTTVDPTSVLVPGYRPT